VDGAVQRVPGRLVDALLPGRRQVMSSSQGTRRRGFSASGAGRAGQGERRRAGGRGHVSHRVCVCWEQDARAQW
jgi:hypothetical protein